MGPLPLGCPRKRRSGLLVIVATSSFLMPFVSGQAVAQSAADTDPIIITSPSNCGLSVHGQSEGTCVWLRTPRISNYERGVGWIVAARWHCPADYPYPYIGFGSDNPVWDDHSDFPSPTRMKAAVTNPEGKDSGGPYSWPGRGPGDPGYVAVQILNRPDTTRIQIDYKCSDLPSDIPP